MDITNLSVKLNIFVVHPEVNSREPVSWSSEEISVSRGNLYDHLKLNVKIYEE